jgi:NAD(P)-dependent dehydrogenase (short-subunit alcohol dehydrogenase family)
MSKSLGTAAVTGASAGIGKTYADRLAKRGYDLILIARRVEKLAQYAVELRTKYGVSVDILGADLSSDKELERVAAIISAHDAREQCGYRHDVASRSDRGQCRQCNDEFEYHGIGTLDARGASWLQEA